MWRMKLHEMAGVAGLAYLSIVDIRRKELGGGGIFIFFLLGVFLSLVDGSWRDWTVLFRFVPGVVSLVLSRVSREAIGYGDGLVLCSLAAYGTLTVIGETLCVALLCIGMTGLIAFVLFRKGPKTEIPFVPFLFLGYGWSMFR